MSIYQRSLSNCRFILSWDGGSNLARDRAFLHDHVVVVGVDHGLIFQVDHEGVGDEVSGSKKASSGDGSDKQQHPASPMQGAVTLKQMEPIADETELEGTEPFSLPSGEARGGSLCSFVSFHMLFTFMGTKSFTE